MSKSVFGIATTHGQAERIVEQLQAQGFAASEISVLMPDTGGTRDVGHVKATKAPEGATTGAATGGSGVDRGLPRQPQAAAPGRPARRLLPGQP